jgi:hypothetical protein
LASSGSRDHVAERISHESVSGYGVAVVSV